MSGWLETLAREPSAGTPAVPPAVTRPKCKNCGGDWNGSGLLLCQACEDDYLDLFDDAQAEIEAEL